MDRVLNGLFWRDRASRSRLQGNRERLLGNDLARSLARRLAKSAAAGSENTCDGGHPSVYGAYPIRTCLWPRAGRWASGQEAGQPPGVGDGWRGWTSLKSRSRFSQGNRSPNSDWQPEAKPANPESPRGTQLKATTERAFLVSLVLQRSTPKRLVLHCRACGVNLPIDGVSGPDALSVIHGVSIAPWLAYNSAGYTSHRRRLRRGSSVS
jgi:hypothetical protein